MPFEPNLRPYLGGDPRFGSRKPSAARREHAATSNVHGHFVIGDMGTLRDSRTQDATFDALGESQTNEWGNHAGPVGEVFNAVNGEAETALSVWVTTDAAGNLVRVEIEPAL